LKEGATAVSKKCRPIPYSLRELVDKKLDILEQGNVVERIDYSEWSTPIKPIPKGKGIRMCIAYNLTLNDNLEENKYPIPRVDDLFNEVRGSSYFCKLFRA
jgi:hypothetical protein